MEEVKEHANESEEEEEDDGVPMISMEEKETHDVDDDTVAEFFGHLYKEYPMQVAKQVSREERRTNGYVSTTLVYGEIEFAYFRQLFKLIQREHDVLTKPGGVFLDIGCGSGRPVFAAALLHDFDACVGYEILEGLAGVAMDVAGIWQREKKTLNSLKKRTRIVIENEDATQVEWPLADLIFCNSTCFDDRLMRAITKQALGSLKKGGVIVTATKPLMPQDNQEIASISLVQKCKMQESWGDATMYIHKRSS